MKVRSQRFMEVFGYRIVSKKPPRPKDMKIMGEDFRKIHEDCKDYHMTPIEREYALYKAVEYIVDSNVPGDFVECGVWKGGSSMIMAKTLLSKNETTRKIYLYDTFEGMPEPAEIDTRISDGRSGIKTWKEQQKEDYNEWCYVSLEEVKTNMQRTEYPEENLVFVKGKVEDTIPGTVPQKIALLRLDTDFFESTYHELVHLFPLLSNGGVLILDDYGHWAGAKKAVDQYFKENNITILLNRIDYAARLGIKYNLS